MVEEVTQPQVPQLIVSDDEGLSLAGERSTSSHSKSTQSPKQTPGQVQSSPFLEPRRRNDLLKGPSCATTVSMRIFPDKPRRNVSWRRPSSDMCVLRRTPRHYPDSCPEIHAQRAKSCGWGCRQSRLSFIVSSYFVQQYTYFHGPRQALKSETAEDSTPIRFPSNIWLITALHLRGKLLHFQVNRLELYKEHSAPNVIVYFVHGWNG